MNRKPAKQVNRQIRIISEIWRWSSSICWRGTAVPKCAILSKMIRQFNANYFCGPQLDEKINKNWSLAYFDKTDLIKAAGNSFEITLCSPHSVLPQTSMTVPPHFLLLRPSAVLPWRRECKGFTLHPPPRYVTPLLPRWRYGWGGKKW